MHISHKELKENEKDNILNLRIQSSTTFFMAPSSEPDLAVSPLAEVCLNFSEVKILSHLSIILDG